ncbi:hypothetical protein BaRGS_00028728, partial [Batillaria attramentaria]
MLDRGGPHTGRTAASCCQSYLISQRYCFAVIQVPAVGVMVRSFSTSRDVIVSTAATNR